MLRVISLYLVMHSTFSEKITFISTERPARTYMNTKYFTYANITSRRYGRVDPFYYVEIHAKHLMPMGNNIETHFYFYEFLTNRYKRGFFEMHFKFCDLIQNDSFFGFAMKQGIFAEGKCPYPPGEFHLYNMTVPVTSIPIGFPFTKGRIYMNCTTTAKKELILSGYIDMEIKVYDTEKRSYSKY